MVKIQKTLKEIKSTKKQGSVITLCCGYGSNTIGYNLAGLNVNVAVDINEKTQDIYMKNHPEVTYINKDLKDLTGDEVLANTYLEKYDLDILDASPPSNLQARHTRIPDNQRTDNILLEIGRLIEELMPKVFIINNDTSLSIGKTRLFLNEILEIYEEIGYRVDMEVLESSFYEVPQKREKLFIIGVRNDLKIKPVFPEVVEKRITTKDAISDLANKGCDIISKSSREIYMKKYFRPGCTAKEIKEIAKENNIKVYGANYKRDKWDSPYYELKSHTTRPFHPKIDRVLSIWEALRLQTYPDDYILSDNHYYNWKNICNSIPPNLTKNIANSIRKEILEKLF